MSSSAPLETVSTAYYVFFGTTEIMGPYSRPCSSVGLRMGGEQYLLGLITGNLIISLVGLAITERQGRGCKAILEACVARISK